MVSVPSLGEIIMAEASGSDGSLGWLMFFSVCFILVMSIGAFAIFTYNANAPEPKPASGAHGSMILPGDGQYAPNVRIYRQA